MKKDILVNIETCLNCMNTLNTLVVPEKFSLHGVQDINSLIEYLEINITKDTSDIVFKQDILNPRWKIVRFLKKHAKDIGCSMYIDFNIYIITPETAIHRNERNLVKIKSLVI
jgi:hypothetical protein